MTYSVNFIRASEARQRVIVPHAIEETKLKFFQRLHALAIAIFRGIISNFQMKPLREESASVSQEAWREFLFGNRFEFLPTPVGSFDVPTKEETLRAQFVHDFEQGKQLYKLGSNGETNSNEVAIRLHGQKVSSKAIGFVVRHLCERNVDSPNALSLKSCFSGAKPTIEGVVQHLLALKVHKDDGAVALFNRIVEHIRTAPTQEHGVYEDAFI